MLQVGALDNQWDNRKRWRDLAVLQKGHYFNRLYIVGSALTSHNSGVGGGALDDSVAVNSIPNLNFSLSYAGSGMVAGQALSFRCTSSGTGAATQFVWGPVVPDRKSVV